MRKSLNGTTWRCIIENMDEYDMTATVTDGEINPDWNGDNDIEIRYEDGSISYMKLRRFITRFEQL